MTADGAEVESHAGASLLADLAAVTGFDLWRTPTRWLVGGAGSRVMTLAGVG